MRYWRHMTLAALTAVLLLVLYLQFFHESSPPEYTNYSPAVAKAGRNPSPVTLLGSAAKSAFSPTYQSTSNTFVYTDGIQLDKYDSAQTDAEGGAAKDAPPSKSMGMGMNAPAGSPSPGASPAKNVSASDSTPAQTSVPESRKVVYTATVSLHVASKDISRKAIEDMIRRRKGMIVLATLDQITFRVPPNEFDPALNELAGLGDVTDREVKSEDVTDQYRDLALRADVAEASRKRLMDLLSKAGQVKDVLEIERDIRRLTEEIERMKGQLRLMQNKVDMATIHARLFERVTEPIPAANRRSSSLFAWINGVGLDRLKEQLSPSEPLSGERSLRRLCFGPRFKLGAKGTQIVPDGFVPVRYNQWELMGSTPEDYRVRIRYLPVRQETGLDFWEKTLADDLRSFRGYTLAVSPASFKLDQAGLRCMVLRCQALMASEPWSYDVWLVQKADAPKDLYVIEFGRAAKDKDKFIKAVEEAIRGIKIR